MRPAGKLLSRCHPVCTIAVESAGLGRQYNSIMAGISSSAARPAARIAGPKTAPARCQRVFAGTRRAQDRPMCTNSTRRARRYSQDAPGATAAGQTPRRALAFFIAHLQQATGRVTNARYRTRGGSVRSRAASSGAVCVAANLEARSLGPKGACRGQS